MSTHERRICRGRWLALAAFCAAGACAATAGNIDATNRNAWAENIGWTVFTPTNGGVTVHFDGSSGWLAGYAWGENIGWVKLGDNTGGPYNNTSSTDWGVNLSASSNLAGFAWGENVGWIKFDPAHSQTTIDEVTGQFDGYAWGENVGWIHFQGASPDYQVRTKVFDKHPMGTPDWWLALYGVIEEYDEGDGVVAWREYVADTNPTNAGSYLCITAISNAPLTSVFLLSSANRVYTLQRRDELLSGAWADVSGQINVQGVGGLHSLQDGEAALRRFYRITVRLP